MEVAEAPAVEAPVQEAVAPEPVEPPSPGAPEVPAERVDLGEALKTATDDEFEVLLQAAPPEVRERYEEKLKAKGAEAAQTRKTQATKAATDRLAAFKPWIDNLPAAHAYVQQQMAQVRAGGMFDDPVRFDQVKEQIRVGSIGQLAQENEGYVQPLLDTFLPDMTAEEAQKLDKPMFKFGQTGMAKDAVNAIFELAVERAKTAAFEEGVKKGEGNLAAKESLIDKLKKTAEIKKQSPGLSLNGRPADPQGERTALMREIDAVDPRDPQANQKLDALRKRLRLKG